MEEEQQRELLTCVSTIPQDSFLRNPEALIPRNILVRTHTHEKGTWFQMIKEALAKLAKRAVHHFPFPHAFPRHHWIFRGGCGEDHLTLARGRRRTIASMFILRSEGIGQQSIVIQSMDATHPDSVRKMIVERGQPRSPPLYCNYVRVQEVVMTLRRCAAATTASRWH